MALAPQTPMQVTSSGAKAPLVKKIYIVAFCWVTSLFFMWAIANNFNDILIKQFQKALDLSRMQSGLVQTAFYFGYFTMALPAGWVMTKIGYKNGILIGLALYALGALLFVPASSSMTFGFFLFALYIIASGLAFLETAANPFVTVMGPPESAAQRLNLAQSFNGLGGFMAPFIGGALIFSGIEHSAVELAAMAPEALDAYRASEAAAVRLPYIGLAAIVTLLAIGIFFTKFPKIEEPKPAVAETLNGKTGSIWAKRQLPWAVIAQFFYVGAQVGIWSYFINFSQELGGVGEKAGANFLGISLMGFMIGRFIGTFLMRFVNPNVLLTLYALICTGLCVMAMMTSGMNAVYALGLTSFFMSIMFPTIFALGVQGLGAQTKLGSSFIIMAIIGGAIFPPVIGYISDQAGSIQAGLVLPIVAFLVVALFGWRVAKYHRPTIAI